MPAKLATPPTTSAEVRSLMASEVVKSSPDKDRLRFLGELLVSFEGVEARSETAASKLLPAVTTERDALLARVAELEPLAAQLPDMTARYNELKSNFDVRITAMREELISESQAHQWKAERSEHAAKDILMEAQAKFGQSGLQLLLDQVKRIIEENRVPEPDPASLPLGISPMFLTIWGHTPVKAQLLIAYANSFPEPSENFKQTLFRVLRAGLPQYEGMSQSDPIPDLAVKREVLIAMAQRWNVLDEVQRRIDDEAVQRQADFLRNHYAQMQSQSNDAALRGEGRTEIGVEEQSTTGYTGPHDPACCCGKPGCNPLPGHLRAYEIPEAL
jgi:hypothetical protein